ncbi:hypothetical protein B0J11DRAFT_580693 [Dendryphion nanum]|uniref:Uncharacterized protein n=1 Tax=Dendryphion nanum TaxID=256645 RepID=A0A9P9DRV3_9PLEO|nr:hypothetical protein B0J11DRAFT_580693 [Dendryphion nanum]
MDQNTTASLISTANLISATLDTDPDAWRDRLQIIRDITASLEILDTVPDQTRKQWQLPLIAAFQRVAFADADSGGVLDIANWCLRQELAMHALYPDDVDLLALTGQNWLQRAQKSLAKIHATERHSSSSGGSADVPLSRSEEVQRRIRAAIEAEDRLSTADYVEARGILLPATEYLKRAVVAARTQGAVTGNLLSMAAEAYMSLGNVSSSRVNEPYFIEARAYLREASAIHGYSLALHLDQ